MKVILFSVLSFLFVGVQSYYYIENCRAFNDGNISFPTKCPPGTTYYLGHCNKLCPAGYTHTDRCRCSRGVLLWETSDNIKPKYSMWNTLFGCPEGQEIFKDDTCHTMCPDGLVRKSLDKCMSDDYDVLEGCDKYGPAGEKPTCGDDEDILHGFCFKPKCPETFARITPCICAQTIWSIAQSPVE